jgi:ketosteroid isomerase-like protein
MTPYGNPPRPGRPAAAPRRARRWARAVALAATLATTAAACREADGRPLARAERAAIADSIARQVMAATDLSRPDVVARMMSLYPATGSVVSASGGRVTTSRDSLEAGIRTFWNSVGRNMRDPRWEWRTMRVDVLAPNAAVMTATYRIPHHTPSGMPHVIGGAWTAVFERRDGRWVIVHEHLSDAPPEPQ